MGYHVRLAGSAEAALAALKADARVDLVFSDIVMAGDMDGLQLAQRIRELHPGLPVLLATGYSEAAARRESQFPILTKPYQLEDLSRAMGALLERRDAPDGDSDPKVVKVETWGRRKS